MSQFKQQYQEALRGGASLESAEIAAAAATPVDSSVWSNADVQEVREERATVIEAKEAARDLSADAKFLGASDAVTSVVSQAANAAETMPPAVADSFVSAANVIIGDAGKVIGTDIPKLECDDRGMVTDASMESLTGWFSTAAKAFKASAGQFLGRIALTFVRLNDSSKGLINRCSRVRSKIRSRKGDGGKPLRLNSSVTRLLVLGDNYATNPVQALQEFSKVSLAVSKVVEEYHSRVDKVLKAKIFDVLANSGGNKSMFTNIDTADLVKELNDLLAAQPKLLLGNVTYTRSDSQEYSILGAMLQEGNPSAEQLVKHLDAPQSLSSEDVIVWVKGIEDLVSDQMKSLERITDTTTRSFDNVRSTLEKLNYNENDVKAPYLADDIDTVELLRLESQVVNEIGGICEKLATYQSDLVERISAVLTVVEESLFQD